MICTRPQDAEYIVAKAIHDGVIDAVLDRSSHSMSSKDTVDVYSTREPQLSFQKRIDFCNEIHNSAITALRFPPNAHKTKGELAAEEAERQKEQKDAEGTEADGEDLDD